MEKIIDVFESIFAGLTPEEKENLKVKIAEMTEQCRNDGNIKTAEDLLFGTIKRGIYEH